jgi:hypothetical protein
LPRLRRPRLLPRQLYPGPKAERSNELHESIWSDRSTSRVGANGTTSGSARMPSMAPFACVWPIRGT